jgi:hypothetical protein
MNLEASILGSTAVKHLQESAASPVLQVGTDRLTRSQLAAVECYNFHAARLLTHILHDALKVPNLQWVYDKLPPAALAVPRMGVVSLAVLGAAFEAKGIGGSYPLASYVQKHRNGDKVVTFETLKHRDQVQQAQERKATKRRKAQRRDQAHKIRVERFTKRDQQGWKE